MDIFLKILITQLCALLAIHILMYPGTLLANYMEKKIGDYGKALDFVIYSQVALILITFILWLWN